MSEVFRPLAEKDIETFQRFLTAAYADDLQYGIRFQAAFATVEDIKKHLAGNPCYILERDGEIISSCSLRMPWGPNPGPDVFPHLGWVSTHPRYKQQGFSSRMLDWVEQEILIKQFKAPAVTLGTAEEHPWLIRMYEKRGYVAYEKRRLHEDHVTVYMKKVLKEV
ncbi:MAG: GNAT family N-acetyltransferase [Acidaminococcaceae bacterium]|nr:GNAT family N-acetyltransferase [Acidaminococcaceae bacterium]MBQ9635626.1 GNAT family N-acetyltransferase [Acidaminococcaceae bacterium]MBR1589781.1 GNAT family N-acetyltransferase [Acidaminococcaceae bacterium]